MTTYMLKFYFDPKDARCETVIALCCELDIIRDTLQASGVQMRGAQSVKDNEFELFVSAEDWQRDTMMYLCRAFCRERNVSLQAYLETLSITYTPVN